MTDRLSRNFKLTFSLEAAQGLDAAASTVSQISNRGNWFFTFRRSMSGVTSRLYGLSRHYEGVHEWYVRLPHPNLEIEYHVASILFSMDSAIECFTYALNAFGNGIDLTTFRDVTDAGALRKVQPDDIIGTKISPRPGYARYFPQLQGLWQKEAELIARIMVQHDVSKHRFAIAGSGKYRMDPPPGFFESLNVPEGSHYRFLLAPMEEIIMDPDPKAPMEGRVPTPVEKQLLLEDEVEAFCSLIDASFSLALADVRATVPGATTGPG